MDINTFMDEVVTPNIQKIERDEKQDELCEKVGEYFYVACGFAADGSITTQIKEAKSAYNKAVTLAKKDPIKSTALFLVSMEIMLICYLVKCPDLGLDIYSVLNKVEKHFGLLIYMSGEWQLFSDYQKFMGIIDA